MLRRNRRAAAAAAVLLALAGTPALGTSLALGQSAGDDQYEDPFAGGEQEQTQEPDPTATPEPAPSEPAPAPSSESAPAPAPASAEEPGAPSAELPRTGLDAGPILALGAVMLAGGVALRVRLRERS
jgi:hypothetical protein